MNILEEKFSDAIYNAEQDYEEYKFEVGAKSCTAIAIDFAKGFSEWLQLNRWFTYDQFKQVWYYTFEQGTSMSEANYLKNYTKTTDQLITIYIESLK